jgi:hypothetical protein
LLTLIFLQKMDRSPATTQPELHMSGMDKILAKLSPKPQPIGKRTPLPKGVVGKTDDKQPLQPLDQPRESRSVSSPPQGSNKDHSIFERAASKQTARPPVPSPTVPDTEAAGSGFGATEMLRLKRELMVANSRIAQQEQELAETRVIKHTIDQALGTPSEAEFEVIDREMVQHNVRDLQPVFNASAKGPNQDNDLWLQDDATSDISESYSGNAYGANRNLWGIPAQAAFGIQGSEKGYQVGSPVVQDTTAHPWTALSNASGMNVPGVLQQHRVFSGPSATLDGRYAGEHPYMSGINLGPRRSVSQINRAPAYFQSVPSPSWATLNNAVGNNVATKAPLNPAFNAYQQVGLYPMPQYQPRPIGTPLSPTAAEFTSNSSAISPWNGATVCEFQYILTVILQSTNAS